MKLESRPRGRAIKTVGGRNLPAYWRRFDRLQRTAEKLLKAEARTPRGVYRFSSYEDIERWRKTHTLRRPDCRAR